jgi:N-acetylglucosamine kinase-like BadF-type ATPase
MFLGVDGGGTKTAQALRRPRLECAPKSSPHTS